LGGSQRSASWLLDVAEAAVWLTKAPFGSIRERHFYRTRKFLRSLDNWRRGFAFGYVRRCRACGHTAYYPDHCDA